MTDTTKDAKRTKTVPAKSPAAGARAFEKNFSDRSVRGLPGLFLPAWRFLRPTATPSPQQRDLPSSRWEYHNQ